jgi:hypothetical protein
VQETGLSEAAPVIVPQPGQRTEPLSSITRRETPHRGHLGSSTIAISQQDHPTMAFSRLTIRAPSYLPEDVNHDQHTHHAQGDH